MKRYVEIERNHANIIQNRYRCAWCWNPVRVAHDKDGDYITCGDENCRCEGLITTRFVEKLIAEREVKARVAREILQEQFEWLRIKKVKRTQEELMSELGF